MKLDTERVVLEDEALTPPPKENETLDDLHWSKRYWRFYYNHSGPMASFNVETGAMTPTEAGQYLDDTVSEMRAIMGRFKQYPRVEEPSWLTEAVKERKDEK